MKNAIIYFYGLNIDELKKINNNYYFSLGNDDFVIMQYSLDINDSIYMYQLNQEMVQFGMNTYKIVLTNENNVLFDFEGVFYLLMIIPKIKNRIITYDDILYFNYFVNDDKILNNLDKSNWGVLWSNKVDYIEYQFSQLEKKYSIIKENINYFIGLWENAISYYNDNFIEEVNKKQVVHKRITVNSDLLEFYNPLNLIVDYKERDISEYLKSFVLEKNYSNGMLLDMLNKANIDKNSSIRLITRSLFPSYFFDKYDEIIIGLITEDELRNVVVKQKNIISLLNIMFSKYKINNIPLIEWIKKEE